MDGVVTWNERRAHIQLYVNHPPMATLQHLLEGDALQVAVGQWLPRSELLVVGAELRHLFHHIVAQLVAAFEEVTDGAGDALLLIHLRDGLSLITADVCRAENLAHQVLLSLETTLPQGTLHTSLFL